ncbi:hypothetical protein [Rhodocyclus gracilis]|uniref:hypothetical protein n=1 Tax=Rhodocyclus gracilis TaxID=2929842 RepID=UPI001E477590|nr:hypothetical protein [Rhodocyclus gracilis]
MSRYSFSTVLAQRRNCTPRGERTAVAHGKDGVELVVRHPVVLAIGGSCHPMVDNCCLAQLLKARRFLQNGAQHVEVVGVEQHEFEIELLHDRRRLLALLSLSTRLVREKNFSRKFASSAARSRMSGR